MPNKMLPISVRISLEDATFLTEYKIAGATSPSEKIRALIREARHRRNGVRDYKEGLMVQEEEISQVLIGLRTVENEAGQRSEMVNLLAHWLPETLAYFLSHSPISTEEDVEGGMGQAQDQALVDFEVGLAHRTMALFENVLRLAMTNRNPCYDPNLLNNEIESVLELSEILLSLKEKKGGCNT